MLYVFHVDRGTLVTFDMQLSLAFVQDLKIEIERAFCIPCDKQVLMVSGGQWLEDTARVCNFGTGTDTNPVYLFSRELAENFDPPMPLADPTPDIDLTEQTENAKCLPKLYNTIVVRTKLAHKFYELSREQSFMCERLVLDQHRQQQGWAAVAAHLEDTVNEFRKRSERFLMSYQCQQEENQKYMEHLQKFPENLEVLSKIPVIPALLDKLNRYSDEAKLTELMYVENQDKLPEPNSEPGSPYSDDDPPEFPKDLTLLQWVAMKDQQYSLEEIAYLCTTLMEELNEVNIEMWKKERDDVIGYIYSMPLKEISGLGDRLFGLDQLLGDVKSLVNSQGEIATSFAQNQSRASDLRDQSVIPDLCKSHSQQLGVMLENYNKIRDIKRRCRCAKEELCINLHRRLKWVVQSEKQLTAIDCKLSLFVTKQSRLQHTLRVIAQINQAPEMYIHAVTEVVRRRHFSQAFLSWASDLACHLTTIHNEEVMKRREFHAEFEPTFLVSLFAGLNDMPPSYATEPPQMFDVGLPILTLEDVENIKSTLPGLAEKVKMPDFAAISQFFQTKSLSGVKFEERGVGDGRCFEDRLVQVVTEAGVGSALDRGLLRPTDSQTSATSSHFTHPHLKDFDRGFESETDTEEFEKVGQSPIDLQVETKQEVVGTRSTTTLDASTLTEGHQGPSEFVTTEYYIDESMPSSLSTDGGGPLTLPSAELLRQLDDSNTVVALLQENLATSKSEVERLKGLVKQAGDMSKSVIALLRSEMAAVKLTIQSENSQITESNLIFNAWEKYEADRCLSEREKIQRLTVDHELEMNDVKKLAIAKDDEIRSLKLEKINIECMYNKRLEEAAQKLAAVETQLKETQEACAQHEREMEICKSDHERALAQLREQMKCEHQNEMESLRSRFRFMTVANMERSPSDSSLERIERADVIELVNHESIVAQLKENYSLELETAVKAAVDQERTLWSINFEAEVQRLIRDCDTKRAEQISSAVNHVIKEKDKKIEDLLVVQRVLQRECHKYKESIQQITDGEDVASAAAVRPLLDRVDQLEQDKCGLEAELSMERSKRLCAMMPQMHYSIAGSVAQSHECARIPPLLQDASTSTENRVLRMLSRSQLKMIRQYEVNINTCAVGSRVLIVWSKNHQNYILVMDSSSIYFVTYDCIPTLGLTSLKKASRKDRAVGEVTDKEFCYAKKAENRYHVPKGTRFYRVTVKPLPKDVDTAICERLDMSGPSSASTSSLSNEKKLLAITQGEIGTAEPPASSSHHLGAIPRASNPPSTSKSKSNECPGGSGGGAEGDVVPATRPLVVGAPVSPFVSHNMFGGSPTLSGSFSIYHSLSQPSSLVSCGESEPTTPNKLDDEVDSVPYVQDEKDR